MGIGTLMADGLGDTIRISLTEDPEEEIPVGKKLVAYFENNTINWQPEEKANFPINPFQYSKRKTLESRNIGGNNLPVIVADLEGNSKINWSEFGFSYNHSDEIWGKSDRSPDYLFFGSIPPESQIPQGSVGLLNFTLWNIQPGSQDEFFPIFTTEEFLRSIYKSDVLNFIRITSYTELNIFLDKVNEHKTLVIILNKDFSFQEQRVVFSKLIQEKISIPVMLSQKNKIEDPEKSLLANASDLGGLFLDGLGDGIWVETNENSKAFTSISLAFGILQASRVRTSKTEYISCPSCGRTLFDIQEITARIKQKTQHLKGLKIGIMGCIVNGPGEMADADYGYVGSGKGKISLYKNKEVVKKNIPTETAVGELIQLIKVNGDWIDPV